MFRHLVTSAVFAGFAAGVFAALLQFVFVEPVLIEAELYESGAKVHFAAMPVTGQTHDQMGMPAPGPAAAETASDPAKPGFDLARYGQTLIFMALVHVGYGLLMVAGFALAERDGATLSPRAGLIWGLAGFIAVQLAPAIGLAPELPGLAAADLTGRQVWWVGSVGCTAGALWLIAFGRNWAVWGAAVALLALPHLIGAPEVTEMTGPVPPELAAKFVGRSLGLGLAGWVLLGLLAASFWRRRAA